MGTGDGWMVPGSRKGHRPCAQALRGCHAGCLDYPGQSREPGGAGRLDPAPGTVSGVNVAGCGNRPPSFVTSSRPSSSGMPVPFGCTSRRSPLAEDADATADTAAPEHRQDHPQAVSCALLSYISAWLAGPAVLRFICHIGHF